MSQENFARLEAKELAGELESRMSMWGNMITKNGLKNKWQKAYRMYFGRHWKNNPYFKDSEILQTGDDGELSALTVNDFRNLTKHLLTLTTNQKLSFDPRATNSDEKSITQTRIAKIVLDYYTREKRIRRYLRTAAEHSLVFGKGFVYGTWNKEIGKDFSVSDYQTMSGEARQRIIKDGDIKLSTPNVFDVYVDQSLESWSDVQWVVIRTWANKWDLIAENPELEAQILSVTTKNMTQGLNFLSMTNIEDSNLVPVYEFYHERSSSMPSGRYLKFLNADAVLYDDAIPYDRIPIFRIVPGDWFGSTEGYTEGFDIMNLQQAKNVLTSTFYTNQSTFGVQNVLIPDGCNLTALQLSKGLQGLKYNPSAGKPEALQLTSTPPELWKGLEFLSAQMETVYGINSVTRGNVGDDKMSGKALGLLQSMAIQYSASFQESYVELAEDVGSFMIYLLKTFAKTERMASIAGKFNKGDMIKFSGEDLSSIERVVVELGNPYQKTLAGRSDIAEKLLTHGLIKNPSEYIQVLDTGMLEASTEGPESQLALIRQENEMLQENKPVIALVTDKHPDHINEHMVMLSRPDIRMNSQLTGLILNHVQEHIMLAKTQDPYLAMIKGEPPPMPMMPPPMMGSSPMAPPGPQQGNPNIPSEMPIEPPPGPQQALQESLK